MYYTLLIQIREAYGTQRAFAAALKTDEANVSNVLRGNRNLSPNVQNVWAAALGCDRGELFCEAVKVAE